MKDSILIDAREFISVSRASEITKYSNDYIGQLCREGKVAARMLGRTWFIDRESLVVYKNSVEAFSAQSRIGQTSQTLPSADEAIDSHKYVSVAEAAALTKYSKDYVGQLCREGKISARMVSRTWFIDRDSLLTYKDSVEAAYANNAKPKEPVLPRALVESKKFAQSTTQFVEKQKESLARGLAASLTYMAAEGAALPMISKNASHVAPVRTETQAVVASPKRRPSMVRVAFVTLAVIAVVVSGSGAFMYLSSGGSHNGPVAIDTQAPNVASVAGVVEAIRDFFGRVFGGKSQTLATNVPKPPPKPGGIAIVPSSNSKTQDELIKQRIQESFSDEVTVNPDGSGTAGVITPVFRKATGDSFVYVLVPVNEQSNKQ